MTTIKLYLNKFIKLPSFLKLIDNILKKIFLTKTKHSFLRLNKPYWIIINDDLLKFHDNDIRKEIKKEILFFKKIW